MKSVIKKICKYSLLSVFLLVALFSMNIKSEADWGGVSTLDTYKQVETDMRAVWVATVGNLNIAPQTGKGEVAINQWKGYYLEVLDNAEANNLNTIIFQIRPANDAFYPSKYNPWSTYLVADGTDPGWDPLEWMIEVTHERGMEYHAWLNPYRASTSTLQYSLTEKDPVTEIEKMVDVDQNELNTYKETYFNNLREKNPTIDNPVLKTGSELHYNVVLGSEGKFILNPASDAVIEHINNTIEEIVVNYDIDGIHFDDYFYPNDTAYKGNVEQYKGKTYSSEPYYDVMDYNNYLSECSSNGVEAMNVYDWRRDNVNNLIKGLGELIREKNQEKTVKCAFGISPAARWAPSVEVCSSEPYRGAEGGMGGSCNDYYSYSDLFADTYKWAKEGWIDYIVPQNYTNLKGEYSTIMKWWSNALAGYPVKLYVGTALYRVSNSWGDVGASEIFYQIRYNQTYDFRVDGYFLFSYSSMLSGMGKNAMNSVSKYAWKYDTLTPLYSAYTYEKLVKEKSVVKKITLGANDLVSIEFSKVEGAKAYGLFKAPKGETPSFEIANVVTREINPNSKITFTKDSNYDYYLVTYDNDNTIYSEYDYVDVNNKAPEVMASLDKEQYYLDEEVKINLTINDNDSTSHSVVVLYAANGKDYIYTAYNNDNVTTQNLEIPFKLLTTKVVPGSFKIEVRDSLNTITKYLTVNMLPSEPVVEVTLNKDSYVLGDTTILNINILDKDSKDFFVSLIYAPDGVNFNEVVVNSAELSGIYETVYSHKLTKGSSNASYKVIVNDGLHTIEKVIEVEIKNESPVVTLEDISDIKAGEKILVYATVEDSKYDELTGELYVSYDGTNYELLSSVEITDGVIISESIISKSSNNVTVKLVISDGTNIVEVISNQFKVESVESSATPGGDGNSSTSKKGCGCGKSIYMFEVISAITLLAFVLRKKGK